MKISKEERRRKRRRKRGGREKQQYSRTRNNNLELTLLMSLAGTFSSISRPKVCAGITRPSLSFSSFQPLLLVSFSPHRRASASCSTSTPGISTAADEHPWRRCRLPAWARARRGRDRRWPIPSRKRRSRQGGCRWSRRDSHHREEETFEGSPPTSAGSA